jgi:hypothetical protein
VPSASTVYRILVRHGLVTGHATEVPKGVTLPALEDTHARASGLCVLGRSGLVAPDEQIADSVTPIDAHDCAALTGVVCLPRHLQAPGRTRN